ncbi:beta-phosphoglucomutase [Anaerocolumna xylanovorans]|uniref:Beta-phosphoglucomutase n=1 Tax=Anaerocolumna xylanovorans DSM 12503 TaxID=1121345 RepID=A0A1M7Y9K9_9FIRM|nr:beta-phosphoglucomutase [Anaerocolumna xylanovorans]SHO49325.1 beta-phosphoglucomutase [Anaerocolumna xylanovorans DSM 12503]
MKYKAVIFDLDGVICHTDRYHYLAWKQLADKIGIYFDESINNRLRGVSRMESLEIILEQWKGTSFTEEEKIGLAEEKNAIYKELLKQMTEKDLSIEVKDTLERLRKSGILLSIGSSSKNAGFILERIGLTGFFDAISDGNNITKSKPDPEVFLLAAQYLKTEPGDCLVVEDARAGIDAAAAAGMGSAAIGDALGYSLADYNLKEFKELIEICGVVS